MAKGTGMPAAPEPQPAERRPDHEPEPVSPADLLDQSRVVVETAAAQPHAPVVEANEADVLEQEREVLLDDEDRSS
jgi:hypothetical protein